MLWSFLHKKYQDHIPCSCAYKVACVDDRFTKPVVVYRGKNAVYEFIKALIKEYKYCKKVMNKHFNKHLNNTLIWSRVKKKNIYFNKVIVVGFVKNVLIMMKKNKRSLSRNW